MDFENGWKEVQLESHQPFLLLLFYTLSSFKGYVRYSESGSVDKLIDADEILGGVSFTSLPGMLFQQMIFNNQEQ